MIFALVLLFLILVPAALAAQTWVLMLLLGAVHHDIAPVIPALGFWQTLVVVLILNVVSAIFRGARAGVQKSS